MTSATPVHLPVLPADDVRALDDRFRCTRYSATLAARACLERQRAATSTETPRNGEALRFDSKLRGDLGLCRSCPVGERVAEQVGPAPELPRRAAPAFGRRCGLCRGAGHTARTCSRRAA